MQTECKSKLLIVQHIYSVGRRVPTEADVSWLHGRIKNTAALLRSFRFISTSDQAEGVKIEQYISQMFFEPSGTKQKLTGLQLFISSDAAFRSAEEPTGDGWFHWSDCHQSNPPLVSMSPARTGWPAGLSQGHYGIDTQPFHNTRCSFSSSNAEKRKNNSSSGVCVEWNWLTWSVWGLSLSGWSICSGQQNNPLFYWLFFYRFILSGPQFF